jgi:hypothetical protein
MWFAKLIAIAHELEQFSCQVIYAMLERKLTVWLVRTVSLAIQLTPEQLSKAIVDNLARITAF